MKGFYLISFLNLNKFIRNTFENIKAIKVYLTSQVIIINQFLLNIKVVKFHKKLRN